MVKIAHLEDPHDILEKLGLNGFNQYISALSEAHKKGEIDGVVVTGDWTPHRLTRGNNFLQEYNLLEHMLERFNSIGCPIATIAGNNESSTIYEMLVRGENKVFNIHDNADAETSEKFKNVTDFTHRKGEWLGLNVTGCLNTFESAHKLDSRGYDPSLGLNTETLQDYLNGEEPLNPIEKSTIGTLHTLYQEEKFQELYRTAEEQIYNLRRNPYQTQQMLRLAREQCKKEIESNYTLESFLNDELIPTTLGYDGAYRALVKNADLILSHKLPGFEKYGVGNQGLIETLKSNSGKIVLGGHIGKTQIGNKEYSDIPENVENDFFGNKQYNPGTGNIIIHEFEGKNHQGSTIYSARDWVNSFMNPQENQVNEELYELSSYLEESSKGYDPAIGMLSGHDLYTN